MAICRNPQVLIDERLSTEKREEKRAWLKANVDWDEQHEHRLFSNDPPLERPQHLFEPEEPQDPPF